MDPAAHPFVTLVPFGLVFVAVGMRLLVPRELPAPRTLFAALAVSGTALATGIMTPIGAISVGVLFTAAGASTRVTRPWQHCSCLALSLAATGPLLLHQAPGFDNPVVAQSLTLSPASAAFDLHWSLDKALVGLAFLGFIVPANPLGAPTAHALARALAIGVVTAALLLTPVVAMAMLHWDPKLHAGLLWWVPANLLITCVAEEAIFRGFVQERLDSALGGRFRGASTVALLLAATAFGAAHVAGGPVYVVAAGLAGVGYGLAYRHGGGIPGAVLAHFTVNAVHAVLLTYPAPVGAAG